MHIAQLIECIIKFVLLCLRNAKIFLFFFHYKVYDESVVDKAGPGSIVTRSGLSVRRLVNRDQLELGSTCTRH